MQISAGEACDTVQLLQAYTRQQDPQRQHGAFYFSTMLGGGAEEPLPTRTVVEVIDTTEQAQLPALRRISYKEADLYAIVYSVMEPEALDEVQKQWIPELQMHGEPGRPVVLIGMHAHKRPAGKRHSKERLDEYIAEGEVQKWLNHEHLSNGIHCCECQGDMGSVRKAFDTCAQLAAESHSPKTSGMQGQYHNNAAQPMAYKEYDTKPAMSTTLQSHQYNPKNNYDPDLEELFFKQRRDKLLAQPPQNEEQRLCESCSIQ